LPVQLLRTVRISHRLFNGLQKVSGKQGGRADVHCRTELDEDNLQIHNATKRRKIYKSNSSSKSDAHVESGNSTDRHLLGEA